MTMRNDETVQDELAVLLVIFCQFEWNWSLTNIVLFSDELRYVWRFSLIYTHWITFSSWVNNNMVVWVHCAFHFEIFTSVKSGLGRSEIFGVKGYWPDVPDFGISGHTKPKESRAGLSADTLRISFASSLEKVRFRYGRIFWSQHGRSLDRYSLYNVSFFSSWLQMLEPVCFEYCMIVSAPSSSTESPQLLQ